MGTPVRIAIEFFRTDQIHGPAGSPKAIPTARDLVYDRIRDRMPDMVQLNYAMLEDRGVLTLSGSDRRSFLQGLVSNDVEKLGRDRVVHAALLTPQGKYLHDFFIVDTGDALALDCERARIDDLARRLRVYKLRAGVSIDDATDRLCVAALMGEGAARALRLDADPGCAASFDGGVVYVDPRLAEVGVRALLPRGGAEQALEKAAFEAADGGTYDKARLLLGLPDGSRDMVVEKAALLECGFEELNGVDFEKGCFLGQELTARTKYRGLVKKRLMPVRIHGPAPALGTPVTLDGKEAGEMRSGRDGVGLALMRLERFEQAAASGIPFQCADAVLEPSKPDWARF
jgi:hypothetical protein